MPLMHDHNQWTRNFATLVSSGLRQPFNRHLKKDRNPSFLRFDHWAGITFHTLPFGFAESCVFTKQSVFPILCGSISLNTKHPFSRSYGIILPSSLRLVLSSSALRTACSPVSVYSTMLGSCSNNTTLIRMHCHGRLPLNPNTSCATHVTPHMHSFPEQYSLLNAYHHIAATTPSSDPLIRHAHEQFTHRLRASASSQGSTHLG